MRRNTRRALFYLPYSFAILGGIAHIVDTALIERDIPHAIASSMFTLGLGALALHCRSVYRRGWNRGFLEGVTSSTTIQQGGIPDVLIRHTATGRAHPDPWDPPPFDVVHAIDPNSEPKE